VGNVLDGDRDGIPGGDFVFSFFTLLVMSIATASWMLRMCEGLLQRWAPLACVPKLKDNQVLSYRPHKQSGQAIVTLSGRDHLLG
jgi:hypothetical protein